MHRQLRVPPLDVAPDDVDEQRAHLQANHIDRDAMHRRSLLQLPDACDGPAAGVTLVIQFPPHLRDEMPDAELR